VSFTGDGGVGVGIINATGVGQALYLSNTEALANVTINLGNADPTSSGSSNSITVASLTLAASTTINAVGFHEVLNGTNQTSVINNGAIAVDAAVGDLTLEVAAFNNNGSIAVSSGDTFIIGSDRFFVGDVSFTDTGTISGLGTVEFDSGTSTLAAGAVVSVAHMTETSRYATLSIAENLAYQGTTRSTSLEPQILAASSAARAVWA
jgi:hypothetical protein